MIDRALFTPDGSNPDYPVPFGKNQTVPTEEMAQLLASLVGSVDSVLEIGTGSGYQTAVLAERCKLVVSIEIAPFQEVERLLPANVVLIHADGRTYDTGDKFDAVLVTFASKVIYMPWLKQLKEGGKLIFPMKVEGSHQCQVRVYERTEDGAELQEVVCYAPFTEAQEA